MSLSTKRESFEATTMQSDSDEENSLDRSNRRQINTPSSDGDNLLNMFRSELSDSDDDNLQKVFKVKKKVADKPNPVPRHLRSKSSTTDNTDEHFLRYQSEALNALEKTINPKAKPRPQPRKGPEEGISPKTSKPEIPPRKVLSDGRTAQNYGMDSLLRMEAKHLGSKSDDDDDDDDSERTTNSELYKERNQFGQGFSSESFRNWKKNSQEENEINSDKTIHQNIVQSSVISETVEDRPHLLENLNKGKDNLFIFEKEAKPIQGKSMLVKKDVNNSKEKNKDLEKKYRGIIPAAKPRKQSQDEVNGHMTQLEHEDDDDKITRESNEKAPLPKSRKKHLVEDLQERKVDPMSISSKSKLQTDGETHKGFAGKKLQMQQTREDEVDGNSKQEKSLDWLSLDKSDDDDDDDDEAVGKNISLFRPSSAKQGDNKNRIPKPLPRFKPCREPYNMEQQNDPFKRKTNYKVVSSTDYDSYQQVPNCREQVNKENALLNITQRVPTSHTPGSNKQQNTTRSPRERKENEDIIVKDDFFEEDNQWLQRKGQLKAHSSITPERGPMRADRGIEEMTRSTHLAQTMTYKDNHNWDYPPQQVIGKQKSLSLTNFRTQDFDYRDYKHDNGIRNGFDTETIRQTVYNNWLSQKNVTIKKELSKKALQKQNEEEKRKEEEERKKNAKLAFKSWNESKTEALKEKHTKMKVKQKEEQERVKIERCMKEKEGKKYFESWKCKKDDLIKETYKEKKKENEVKKKKEREEQIEKVASSKKSFENWKAKKDEFLKQQLKEKKKQEKLVQLKKENESYEKTIRNADEFQKWVENKGKPRKTPPPPTLTQRAWVPGGRYATECIPATVQPVILPPSSNRARTLSGTYRAKTKYYDL